MKMFISSDPVCRTVEGITRSVIGTAVWRTAVPMTERDWKVFIIKEFT